MTRQRRIFSVVAAGGHDTDRHYRETIKNKRTIEEASRFLEKDELGELKEYTKGNPYVVWGAVPGSRNINTWTSMSPGDYVMIYRNGRIILAAEVAMKVRNPRLARYFWDEDEQGETWELVYFLINGTEVSVPQEEINRYLGYQENYFPRGFGPVSQEKVDALLSRYGDLISLLKRIEEGKEVKEIEPPQELVSDEVIDDQIGHSTTEHDEMQWRLIRLGNKARFKVWVPAHDQGREFQGHVFRDSVIDEFNESLDTPPYVKNIDTVWKLGYSIKAAFEVEHSTPVYSGLLRLSDLKAMAPNSQYPLFIVAHRDRKAKVFRELRRPTFSNDYLRLDRVIRYLSYDSVRKLDEVIKEKDSYEIDWLLKKAEAIA